MDKIVKMIDELTCLPNVSLVLGMMVLHDISSSVSYTFP